MNEKFEVEGQTPKNCKFINIMNRVNVKEIISLIASIVTIISVFAGTLYISQMVKNTNINANTNKSTNAAIININEKDATFTMEEDLYNAQNDLEGGFYESAMALYMKWSAVSDIACNNIGYLYSNGLGVEEDFLKACKYYKSAYNMGNELALGNYLYINLAKPCSYDETISALRFGYEQEDKQTIRFLSLVMTERLEEKYSELQERNARQFWDLTKEEQIEHLNQYLRSTVERTEKIDWKETPEDTDFAKYRKATSGDHEYYYLDIAGYCRVYDEETNQFLVSHVNKLGIYYFKYSRYFIYADFLFSEKIAEQ